MTDWLSDNQALAWWLAIVSLVTLVGTLIAVPLIITRMRDDYFTSDPSESEKSLKNRRPLARLFGLVFKNLLGGILVLAGVVLSVPGIPGQGFLTILIGLVIMDFPGKRKLELKIFRVGPVRRAVNWIRKRADRPELILPEMADRD